MDWFSEFEHLKSSSNLIINQLKGELDACMAELDFYKNKNETPLIINEHIKNENNELKKTISEYFDYVSSWRNSKILKSDYYNTAKFFQEALLKKQLVFTDFYPNNFIIYKPKDIVNGDFYWSKIHNETIYIAAVDCVGHGVSGAIMSIQCVNIFERVFEKLSKKKEIYVNDFLCLVRKEVASLIKNTKNQGISNTISFLDLSIIGINIGTLQMQYSGSHGFICIINNSEPQFLKVDRIPFSSTIDDREFRKQEITLGKGDCIYLYTDGYVDQHGGQHERKISNKVFMNLLQTLPKDDMKKQKNIIEEYLHNHKNPNEDKQFKQVDDILIIGVKI